MQQRFFIIVILSALGLITCEKQGHTDHNSTAAFIPSFNHAPSYPLKHHFQCLPQGAALVAAHRGSSKNKSLSENSKEALAALINHGILIAEIDIAQSRDGTHFLYHDGVWDDDSTGKGPVATSHWKDIKNFLLKDTNGRITSHNPVSLEDYLKLAQNKIYLEIDFKSSANYKTVINMLRRYNMADKSILIAYNEQQARALARLAPDMMISAEIKDVSDLRNYRKNGVKTHYIAAWAGRNNPNKHVLDFLRDNNIPILLYPARQDIKAAIDKADLIVSDYALDQAPILGEYDKDTYKECLNKQYN